MFFGPFFSSPQFSFPENAKLIKMGFPIVDGNAIVTLSEAGWTAAIIFLGMLYLWIFVDTFWPSLVGFVLIALSPHYPLPQVIAQYLGNPTTFLIFFIFFFSAALVQSKLVNYLANYLLTRDIMQGRPWFLMFSLMVTTYFAALIDPLSSIFIMWPVAYLVINEIGLKPGDRFANFLVGNTVAPYILGTSTNIIKGPALFMSSGYNSFIAKNPQLGLEQINAASYIFMGMVIAFTSFIFILLAMRFIFRVDISPLRNFDTNALKKNPCHLWIGNKKQLQLYSFSLFCGWYYQAYFRKAFLLLPI